MGGILGGLSRIADQAGEASLYRQQRARELETQDISDQISKAQLRLVQIRAQQEGQPKTTAFRSAKDGSLQVLTTWPDGRVSFKSFGGAPTAPAPDVESMLAPLSADDRKRYGPTITRLALAGNTKEAESFLEKVLLASGKPPATGTKTTGVPSEILAQAGQPPDASQYRLGTKDPAYIRDLSAWGAKVQRMKMQESGALAGARGEAFYKYRPIYVIDTTTQQPAVVAAGEAEKNPTRYAPASEASKAMTKLALIEDIRGNVTQTRDAINAMQKGFDIRTRATLSVALADPATSVGQFFQSIPKGALSPEQQNYIIDLFALRENAMAMRSVLGAGQGSEDLRRAIIQTLPGPGTPDKRYALRQLDIFERILDRLERGVPVVPLRPDRGTAPGSGSPASGNGAGRSFEDIKRQAGVK